MKKCPFCKADIDENARFCIFCMNSLEERNITEVKKNNKKRQIIILSALLVLVFALLTLCIAFIGGNGGEDSEVPFFKQDMSHIFTYRDAVPQDDVNANESIVTDGIVITGVKEPRADGLYVIPETIDGKKVMAIGEYAFADESVRDTVVTVVIPETVKNLHSYCFYKCNNFTDVYILTDALAGSGALFYRNGFENMPITVHSSAECHDRDLRTYKAICEFYGQGTFVEWDGGEL